MFGSNPMCVAISIHFCNYTDLKVLYIFLLKAHTKAIKTYKNHKEVAMYIATCSNLKNCVYLIKKCSTLILIQ